MVEAQRGVWLGNGIDSSPNENRPLLISTQETNPWGSPSPLEQSTRAPGFQERSGALGEDTQGEREVRAAHAQDPARRLRSETLA